jgi:hypothetical protein
VEGAASAEETPPLSKAKEAAKKAREGASKNRQILQEKDRTAAQAAQIARENQALREQLQMSQHQFLQFQQAVHADPKAALRMLGMTEEQLARSFIDQNDPNRELKQLQQELAAERQKREAREKQEQQEREIQGAKNAEKQFVAELEKHADKYPLISQVPTPVLINQAYKTLWELSQQIDPTTGKNIDPKSIPNEHLFYVLESLWAGHTKGKKSPAAPTTAKPADDSESSDPKENDVSGAPEKKPAIKTLTNKLAQQKFTWPKNFDSLSDREQKKVMAEYARSMNMAK